MGTRLHTSEEQEQSDEKFCPKNKRILRMNKFNLKSRRKVSAMKTVRPWDSLLITGWL